MGAGGAVSSYAWSLCSAPVLPWRHCPTILLSSDCSPPTCLHTTAISLFLVTFSDLEATVHSHAAPAKAPRTPLTQRPLSTPVSLAGWLMMPCPVKHRAPVKAWLACFTEPSFPSCKKPRHSLPLSCKCSAQKQRHAVHSPWRSHLGQDSIPRAGGWWVPEGFPFPVPVGVREAG